MTETEFGPGGYGRTFAETPAAPVVGEDTSSTLTILPQPDSNPEWTEYAVRNITAGCWLDASGESAAEPSWRTIGEWGEITARGLDPGAGYAFALAARNAGGVETDLGSAASAVTHFRGETESPVILTVEKETSTVAAPSFMTGIAAGVSIDGKPLSDFGFAADRITGLELPRTVPDEELVPGDHQWLVHGEYFAPKRIVLEGHVHADSPEDLRLRLAYLKSFFATFAGNPWRSQSPAILERADIPGRYWRVWFESADTVEILGQRELSPSARVAVTMKAPLPFAEATAMSKAAATAEGPEFAAVEMGNAPSDAVYVFYGPADAPSFSVGDMIFRSDFTGGLDFTDAENQEQAGTFTPAENEPDAWRMTGNGMGVLVSGDDTVSYTATGNPRDGAWVVSVVPQWRSDEHPGIAVVLEHRWDYENYIRLYWDGAAWVFRKRAEGIDREIASSPQAFEAGTPLVLGITWDTTNAGGMRLYVNGEQAAAGDDLGVLAGAPDTLTLHDGAGEYQPDVVFDMVAGWSRMLSADEMRRVAVDAAAIVNRNVHVSYDGVLDEGDMLVLDSRLRTATLHDRSAGARVNVLGDIDGGIPALVPGRRRTASDRTQTMIRTPSGVLMEVLYRRRYL